MSRLINKEWMNESDRGGHVYTKGVEDFLEFADRTNVTELATIPCPCVKCRNRMRHTPINVRKHLVRNGIDKSYTLWALHGEKPFVNSFIDPIAEDAHQENIREEQILVRELEMRNLKPVVLARKKFQKNNILVVKNIMNTKDYHLRNYTLHVKDQSSLVLIMSSFEVFYSCIY
ncbi:hypothetical protein MIMGU_mgv1a026817mg, partial [Erythranthe guttata]